MCAHESKVFYIITTANIHTNVLDHLKYFAHEVDVLRWHAKCGKVGADEEATSLGRKYMPVVRFEKCHVAKDSAEGRLVSGHRELQAVIVKYLAVRLGEEPRSAGAWHGAVNVRVGHNVNF